MRVPTMVPVAWGANIYAAASQCICTGTDSFPATAGTKPPSFGPLVRPLPALNDTTVTRAQEPLGAGDPPLSA